MTSTLTPRSREPTILVDEDGLVTTYVNAPPDGGWGWVVVVAAFFVQAMFGATVLAVSGLVEAVAVDFDIPMSEASLFSSLFVGCAYCIGPVVSAMAHEYGFRTVTSVGAVIGTFGFVAASFAQSITVLVLTYGILGGIGFGMIFVPTIIVSVFYFERWRALAQGITVCGTSVGGAIAPPLFGLAIDQLGWRNTVLIEACMLIGSGLMSLLYVPLKPVLKRLTPLEMAAVVRAGASRNHRADSFCDRTLFRSPSFLMFGLSGVFTMSSLMIPFVYWPEWSRKLGVDETTIELLVPSTNVASLFGRLACGLLASCPRPIALPIYQAAHLASGLAFCLTALTPNSVFQIAVAALNGLQRAAFNALRAVILVELIGLERLTHAVGFLLFTQGISIMIGPPLAGELSTLTGTFHALFWFAGCLLLIASLFVLPLSCVNRLEKDRMVSNLQIQLASRRNTTISVHSTFA